MPSALKYVPPSVVTRGDFNSAVIKEYQDRRDSYVTALNYYNNEGTDPFTVNAEDPEYDPDDDNTLINLVKMAADRTVSMLFPAMPDVQIDRTSIEDTEEEKWIKQKFLPHNGGLPFFIKWALRGFLAGHTFIWIKNVKPVPRMVLLHPLSVTVFWNADDTNDVLWYEQRYLVGDTVYIRDFVKEENGWRIYLYESQNMNQTRMDEVWEQLTSHGNTNAMYNLDSTAYGVNFEQIEELVHPSDIPPILETAHLPDPDGYYGTAEFKNTALLDTINRIASLRTRIIRTNAEPTDVLTGADLDEIEESDGVVTVPSPNAKVTRLSLSSDLNAVTSTLEHLIEIFLGEMRVVILKGEAKDLQRVTNAAVRTLFLDALAKNSVLWAAYSYTLERIFRLVLVMAYGNSDLNTNPIEKPIDIKMASPLPTDFSEIANINALAKEYRSRHTASVALGDDPKFEEAMLELEHQKNLKQQEEQMMLMHEISVRTGNAENDNSDESGEQDARSGEQMEV